MPPRYPEPSLINLSRRFGYDSRATKRYLERKKQRAIKSEIFLILAILIPLVYYVATFEPIPLNSTGPLIAW